jgi:hypothetical protein
LKLTRTIWRAFQLRALVVECQCGETVVQVIGKDPQRDAAGGSGCRQL